MSPDLQNHCVRQTVASRTLIAGRNGSGHHGVFACVRQIVATRTLIAGRNEGALGGSGVLGL